MSEASPRALTFQEKVQRKRRNKTPTSSAASSPADGTLAPSPSKAARGSPHKAQIKSQLAKAMGLPSPKASVSSPTKNGAPATLSQTGNKSEEQAPYPPPQQQQVEPPLVSTENTIGIQNASGFSQTREETIVQERIPSQNGSVPTSVSRPKTPTRRKLPTWPPQPAAEEETSVAVSSSEQDEKLQKRATEEETVQTEPTTTSSEPSYSIGKAPWIRTSPPTTSANTKKNGSGGKPSWVKPVANGQGQVEETLPAASNSQQKPQWASRPRSPSPAPDTVHVASQQKAPWARNVAGAPPSEGTTPTSTQQKGPWSRSRTPSPAPDYSAVSQQKAPWTRSRTPSPAPDTDKKVNNVASSQRKAQWTKPKETGNAANSYSQQQQTPPLVRPQRAQSPVPVTANVRTERSESPVPSQQKTKWIRPGRTPSPVPGAMATVYSQQKAPWVPPSARTPSPVPAINNVETAEPRVTNHTAEVIRRISSRNQVETFEQRRERFLKRREAEQQQAMEANAAEGADEMPVESVSPREELPVSRPPAQLENYNQERRAPRTKKWPPVRTEPFSNGYKQEQQQAIRQTVDAENLPMTNDREEEPVESQPLHLSGTSPQEPYDAVDKEIVTSSPSDEAHAVKRAPWLRTSPSAPSSEGANSGGPASRFQPVRTDKVEAVESLAVQQKRAWDRRSPSPVPTDEGNQNSVAWSQSAARARSPSPALEDSAPISTNSNVEKQQSTAPTYKKPPTAPQFGASKYVPPWVRAAEKKSSKEEPSKDEYGHPRAHAAALHDSLDAAPSDEIKAPPPVWSGRKQLGDPPTSPRPLSPSGEILNEIKTRRVHERSDAEDWYEEPESEEVAEVVISHGGAVIETPKSVNVASMASSFASGARLSPPVKQKSWKGPLRESTSPAPLTKQKSWKGPVRGSTSPGDPSPEQPQQSPWKRQANGRDESGPIQSPEKSNRTGKGQWWQVKSPPPLWSKEARSNAKQTSSKPPTPQRELSTIQSSKLSSQRQYTPARSKPPAWIRQDASPGDMSSIKSLKWASKQAQTQESSLDRSPPPSWVNRDVSQGELSSIRSPDWGSSRKGPGNGSANRSDPPSWIANDTPQEELSPIESPQQAAARRKVRITVETVDDESADENGRSSPWTPESQTSEYEYPAEEARGSSMVADDDEEANVYSRAQHEVGESDDPPATGGELPPKSPSISLAQMAMDSVFALDFDLAISQTAKEASFDEDESSGSSPSKQGIARSTPPERELPEEVKAMLERSLNRTMSDSRLADDSEAYEADYFSTDLDTSAVDESGSTWNENDISALSDATGLEPMSPSNKDISQSSYREQNARLSPVKDSSHSSSSPRARRMLQLSGDELPVNMSELNEVPDSTLQQIRRMKLDEDPPSESETGSSDLLVYPDVYGEVSRKDRPISAMNRVEAVDRWCGGRPTTPAPRERNSKEEELMNIKANESSIDLGNPTDFSIQVSPESPRQTSLVGTSPALLPDSPPAEFPWRKTVRFGEPESYPYATPHEDYEKEPQQNVSNHRRVTEEWQDNEPYSATSGDKKNEPPQSVSSHSRAPEERLEVNGHDPLSPPVDDDISPASSGAKHILEYFTNEAQQAGRMSDSTEWLHRDPDANDMVSEPSEVANGPHVDWRRNKSPPDSPPRRTTPSQWPGTRDPFSKHDDHDSFFKQDDPFAASKSGSGDFASDFGEDFNPFAEEVDETFDFEKEEAAASTDFFSPYGDVPKGKTSVSSTLSRQTKLTPSRRDRRRRREASAERYDDYCVKTATTFAPSSVSVDDYEECYAQQASYTPSASMDISPKDGTYLLEI